MTFLVASIEHHARVLANAVKRALVEKCSGFSDYEAGDHLEGGKWEWFHDRVIREYYREQLVEREAEQEVPEPKRYNIEEVFSLLGQTYDVCEFCFHMRREHGQPYSGACPAFEDPQTPTAGQRGESPAGDDSPTSPAGSPRCHARKPNDMPNVLTICDELAGHDGEHRHAREFWPNPTDPSPTIASRQHQPSVRGEGSPADSDIPPSPAGERPNWVDWAVPAICDVLAIHQRSRDGYCVNAEDIEHLQVLDQQDWREHVAPLIAERLDTAWRAQQQHKT